MRRISLLLFSGGIKRTAKTTYSVLVKGIIFGLVLGILTGCQTLNPYIGKTVHEPNRIPISESSQAVHFWQTKDMSFDFKYSLDSSMLSLRGELSLDESYEQFETLNHLFLWVHFLDAEGKLLDSKVVWSAAYTVAYTGEKKKWSVKSSLTLPLNATAVAFSYMGSVSQGSDEGGTNWSFYKSPLS